MLGSRVDYHLLKPFARRLRRTNPAASELAYSLDDAARYLNKAQRLYFDNALPVDPGLSYLDVGCGAGELSVGLCHAGVTDVTGIDLSDRLIRQAKATAERLPDDRQPRLLTGNVHDRYDERRYDVVVALAVLEHIDRPAQFLSSLRGLLAPNGRAFLSMTPFHGPLGDHMSKTFRIQIPWRGALFSEQAILRLRRERYRPGEAVERYQDLPGGLNLMRVGQYLRYLDDAGLTGRHIYDPHFRHYPKYWPLAPFSWLACKVPGLRDYTTVNVYSILWRKSDVA